MSWRLASQALARVAWSLDQPGVSPPAYSPLVLTGPSGAGKSRLLTEWFSGKPDAAPAVLWDGRVLARELVSALSADGIDKMHGRFVGHRLVVIDGIDQMTAWDAQRALAHLLDLAMDAGTCVVVSLRAHPIASRGLEPTLASRLSAGLVVSMPPLVAPPCRSVPGDLPDRPRVSLRRIMNTTAGRYGLTAAALAGPSRCRQVATARGVGMYLARLLTTKSLGAIGEAFGGRDHTTALHGIRVTQSRRSTDPAVAADIDHLVSVLDRRPTRRR